MSEIVIVKGIRYRADDARRLGLQADAKVITRNSREVSRTTQAPEGLITTKGANAPGAESTGDKSTSGESTGDNAQGDKSTGNGERPNGNATKADWLAYALENGHSAEQLEGLKRDEIAALFSTNE